ncbi:Hypothetical protein A7982_08092 [Minicystis rosea]|nr:Hypothetical protein A7982_08092 [Minicystis rosea]
MLPGVAVMTETTETLLTHHGDALTFSLDWACARPPSGSAHVGRRALTVIEAACNALAQPHTPHAEIQRHAGALHAALAAEGIELEGLDEPIAQPDPAEQAYASALDRILTSLSSGPATVDWEAETGATRRTLTRRTHAFHAKYGLVGLRKETDWRAVKDFYRLLLSSIFLTHEDATVSSVARAVGYGSPAALCYAFAKVGLPPPGKLRSLVAAG